MRLSGTRWALAALVVAASGEGIAQTGKAGSEFGRHDYDTYCAGCHGATGRGDRVDKPNVDLNPADLTKLAEKNGGVFPYSRFYDVVDGRFDVEPSDMPSFGSIFIEKAAEERTGVRYSAEQYLDRRLAALASHVATLERSGKPVVVVAQDLVRGQAEAKICLDASMSYHTAGRPLSFKWDFGDGRGKATTASACHEFGGPGLYAASATVTDDTGVSESRTVIVSVTAMSAPGM